MKDRKGFAATLTKSKIIAVVSISLLVLTGGRYAFTKLNGANCAGFYDIKYCVEYSPDSTFKYISERYWFYDRTRDKYYLKPAQVDIRHWIAKGPGRFGREDQKFARVKAVVNDSMIYLTKPVECRGCILTRPFSYNQLIQSLPNKTNKNTKKIP